MDFFSQISLIRESKFRDVFFREGPVAISTHPTGENLGDRMSFLRLLIFKAEKSISLKTFFFSFFYNSKHYRIFI
jgi:hypothetical protein